MSTNIEWTNETWNPTTGCTKVSAGCKNCYAEKMSKRLAAMGQEKYQGILTESGRFNGTVRTHEDTLRIPFTWRKPRKVFVNSMSDLFHADVPFWFIDRVFATMALTPQHTYQILTKRPERMAEYLNRPDTRKDVHLCALLENHHGREKLPFVSETWPLPNVWLGTSVEDQAAADERIPHLLKCPAAVRFLSCEPLVRAVDFGLIPEEDEDERRFASQILSGIHWVIAGGESGPNARPMHPDWARGLRDQCQAAGVAFFFKQWGEYGTTFKLMDGTPTFSHFHSFQNWVNKAGAWMRGNICMDTQGRVLHIGADFMKARDEDAFPVVLLNKMGKAKSGRLLDGRTHDEFPESTTNNQPSTI